MTQPQLQVYPKFNNELARERLIAAIKRSEDKVEKLESNTGVRASHISADIAFEQVNISRLRLQLTALDNPWMFMENQLTVAAKQSDSMGADIAALLHVCKGMVATMDHDKDGWPIES